MVAHFTMRTHGVNQTLDLLKAFGYIERVVKPDLFFGNRPYFDHSCAT